MDITLCKVVKFYLKLKHLLYIFIFTCAFSVNGYTSNSTGLQSANFIVEHIDSSTTSMPEDTTVVDTPKKKAPKSPIKNTITYNAKDSIRFDVVSNKVRLYGDAIVDYGTFKLEAAFIEIDWRTSTLTATYQTDSTGKKIGIPLFDQGGDDQYTANVIKYNYKTKKGYISEIVTQEGEGYMTANHAFKDENDNLLMENAKYTTCNHLNPHYHFRLRKTKVIPNKKVITNFFNLYIEDVPVPLGLPFGIFPLSEKKTSGLIMPVYGSSDARGFYLRQGGYYWAINDYADMKFLGEYYANGGGGLQWITNYKYRYHYSGNMTFHYRNVVENGDEFLRTETKDYEFRWRHTPVSRGGRTLSADVNIASSTYNSNLTTNLNQNLTSTLTSNVTYSLPLKGTPFRATFVARHEQNNQTEVVNFTLPSLNVAMTQQYPFRALGKNHVGSKSSFRKFYESVSFGYGMIAQHRVSNRSLSENRFKVHEIMPEDTAFINLESQNLTTLLQRGRLGAQHNIPISGTFNLGSFSFSPSFNYTAYWYDRKNDYEYIAADTSVNVITEHRFASAGQYRASITAQTRLYGMYGFSGFLKGKHETQVRHTLNPSFSFSYNPDFATRDDYVKTFQYSEETDSVARYRTLSRYDGNLYGNSFSSKSASIGFGLNNVLEMKRKVFSKDTTEEITSEYKKIKLLDQLNIRSSYNFIADSLKLSPISINGVTKLFNIFNIQANATLQPYAYDSVGRSSQVRIDEYVWEKNNSIGNLQNLNFSLSASLNPQIRNKKYSSPLATEEQLDYINANSEDYVDFSIPWDLRVSYGYNYSKIGFNEANSTQSLSMSGNISVTPKWKVDGSVSYDFINKELFNPRVLIIRDLHCWVMRLDWVPFGPQQSYEFFIGVKAQILQDLKLTRRRAWIDR